MVKDLLEAVKQIERRLSNDDVFKHLKPSFIVAGSITEGTRFGYANELDLGLRFEALKLTEGESSSKEKIAFKVGSDPFSLKKADTSQTKVDNFFNSSGEFESHKFKQCLLEAINNAITNVFEEGENPPNLHRVVTNKDWQESETPCNGQCRRYLKYRYNKHCELCPVVVSQTKIGITLQFVWKWLGDKIHDTCEHCVDPNSMRGSLCCCEQKDIYVSIDIIPEYSIIPIHAIRLAKIVNTPMVQPEEQPPPEGFVRYLENYDKHYKINMSQDGYIYNVGLKEMNFFEGRNIHIRPAQPTVEGKKKFSSERMRKIYGYIKFLKKNVEGLELSSFAMKKELLKKHYEAILDSCKTDGRDNDDRAVVAILSQPEFRSRVEGSGIDLGKSNVEGRICVKLCSTKNPDGLSAGGFRPKLEQTWSSRFSFERPLDSIANPTTAETQ